MTLTMFFPLTGRFGPGLLFAAGWDLIGPHVPGTEIEVGCIDPSTSAKFALARYPFMTNSIGSVYADVQRTTLISAVEGRADNFTFTLRLEVIVPGSGIVDSLDTTGLHWDPTSGLFYLVGTGALFAATGSSATTATLAAILAAVKTNYHN